MIVYESYCINKMDDLEEQESYVVYKNKERSCFFGSNIVVHGLFFFLLNYTQSSRLLEPPNHVTLKQSCIMSCV